MTLLQPLGALVMCDALKRYARQCIIDAQDADGAERDELLTEARAALVQAIRIEVG